MKRIHASSILKTGAFVLAALFLLLGCVTQPQNPSKDAFERSKQHNSNAQSELNRAFQ